MSQKPTFLQRLTRHGRAVTGLIALNAIVFVLWQLARDSAPLAEFMWLNFLVSTDRLQAGYWWTLVTSAFSHMDFLHIAINMFVLWSFGVVLERLWGARVFLVFYLVAGIVGSACHCLASSLVLGDGSVPALGASGAVAGLLLAFALYYPRHKILLMGILPIPAFLGVLAFIGFDIWGLVAQKQGGGLAIGHGAHLGGALAGALMWFFYLRTHFPRPTGTRLTQAEAEELERILAKGNEHGPESFTVDEHDFLRRIQQRMNVR